MSDCERIVACGYVYGCTCHFKITNILAARTDRSLRHSHIDFQKSSLLELERGTIAANHVIVKEEICCMR